MTQPEHNGHSDVRTIDVGTPPTRFARGWHCLGLSEPFKDGKPQEPVTR